MQVPNSPIHTINFFYVFISFIVTLLPSKQLLRKEYF